MSEYPKKMISSASKIVVLFRSLKEGEVVVAGGEFKLGYKSKSWNPDYFKDIDNRIIKPRVLKTDKL